MKINFDYLNSISKISEETFEELQSISKLKRIPAGTQIIKLDEMTSKIYMLVYGVIRCYISTESGKEFNKSFYLPTSFVGSLTALREKKPSFFTFETLTDCKVYEVDYYELMKLCESNLVLKDLHNNILGMLYTQYEKRLVELISMDATKRYLELRKENPNIDELISQYHIASFLGITAVQLSRIRKKIGVVNIC
ncbi:Crp/Fnr family transcriptional regulator [Thalassobellus suaedae]|uniref:Crp/Fnr family transcriptional regulator n=1 Tax=Thalassobellus suaedae TaxID=3074124 RepID=A0ABY9XWT6_9FLAO|nr:Crp/Fnr family transcriptional regulator [Flavobacteriaceae bacterium HL-DH14]